MGPDISTPCHSVLRMFLLLSILCCTLHPARARSRGSEPPPSQEDTAAWNRYFAAWEARTPDDPNLWIERFNHDFNRARRSVLVLRGSEETRRLPGESDDPIFLTDPAGNTAGSIGEQIVYDQALLDRAIAAIDCGITLHPDRIDMRLGRAAALLYAGRYGQMAESLCRLIDRARENGGRWLGVDGKNPIVLPPGQLVSEYMQRYAVELFNLLGSASEEEAHGAFGRLGLCEAEYCPTSSVALNNVALWHYTAGRVPEALDYFIRASEAAPEDALLIHNIGQLYLESGDRENARKWWEKLLDAPDEADRTKAREILRELEKSVSEK